MKRAELSQLTRFVYATFNKDLLPSEEKTIFRAWYALLHDLPYEETYHSAAVLCTQQKFMPTPGGIRRAYVKAHHESPPPTPQQMWGYLQEIIGASAKGVRAERNSEIAEHLCVRKTLEELGAAAFTMNTNGDRNFVLEAYSRHVQAYLDLPLTVVERNPSNDET
tara:strand:+ start:3257 stop:3751 length:495 start_codon:yes stop_codon:yes gene_type:complete